MSKQALIIGGTGQIGSALVEHLLQQSWRITVLHRGERPLPKRSTSQRIRTMHADRRDTKALVRAIGNGVDAVIDTIAYDESDAAQLLALERYVAMYVVISSASVYTDESGRTLDEASETGFPQFPGPLSEGHGTVSPGPETYSKRKVAMEDTMLQSARVPVTVIRPCAIYGRYSIRPREWWFVKRALDGRRYVPLGFEGASRFHTSSCAGIAKVISAALNSNYAGIINVGDAEPPSVVDIGTCIGRALKHEWHLLTFDDREPTEVGMTPWSTVRPFTLDVSLARRLAGPMPRYEDEVPQVCEWLVESTARQDWHATFPGLVKEWAEAFDYAAEDELIARRRLA